MRHFEYYNDKIVTPRDKDIISICKMRGGEKCNDCTNIDAGCETLKLKYHVQKPMQIDIDVYK